MNASPLKGTRVVEFASGLASSFCGLMLADFGADVIRIDSSHGKNLPDVLGRGKRSISLVMDSSNAEILQKLIAASDIVITGGRICESLNLSYTECKRINESIIYARIEGYPPDHPKAGHALHDLGALAVSGVLAMNEPLEQGISGVVANMPAAFAGGSMTCITGILMAMMERERTGHGQLVETDMVSGIRYLSTASLLMRRDSAGVSEFSKDDPGAGILDGGAPFYRVYTTKDSRQICLNIIRSSGYYSLLLRALSQILNERQDLADLQGRLPNSKQMMRRDMWPAQHAFFTELFSRLDRDEWMALLCDKDLGVAPVLEPEEVDEHGRDVGHADASDGSIPAVVPRMSRTPARSIQKLYSVDPSVKDPDNFCIRPGRDTREILREIGYEEKEIESLIAEGKVSTWSQYDPAMLVAKL